MLQLIRRCPEYVDGYREYCREMWEKKVAYFVPTDPSKIDETWFERTREWYEKKEKGLISGAPVSFHFWAIDDGKFIGEFQLRPEMKEEIRRGIGNIGYAVKPSEWNKGYGTEMLRIGFGIARGMGMSEVVLNINASNKASIAVCEKLGGEYIETLPDYNRDEGMFLKRRYRIVL